MKVNAEAFEELLFLLPLSLLHKYANDLHKLEAILFGLGGFWPLENQWRIAIIVVLRVNLII